MNRLGLVMLAATTVLACTDASETDEPDDADAGGADAGTTPAADCRRPSMDGGCTDGDARDAATTDPTEAGAADAATDASADAAIDAGPSCDPAACPIPSAQTLALLPRAVRACCTEDGHCGLEDSEHFEPGDCIALQEGVPDDDCYEYEAEADADAGAGTLEGCCRTDGVCGHVDPQVGCHEAVSRTWAWELRSCRGADEPPPEAPNPFRCTPTYEACTEGWQCCQDPASNYITLCGGPEYIEVVCEPDV